MPGPLGLSLDPSRRANNAALVVTAVSPAIGRSTGGASQFRAPAAYNLRPTERRCGVSAPRDGRVTSPALTAAIVGSVTIPGSAFLSLWRSWDSARHSRARKGERGHAFLNPGSLIDVLSQALHAIRPSPA